MNEIIVKKFIFSTLEDPPEINFITTERIINNSKDIIQKTDHNINLPDDSILTLQYCDNLLENLMRNKILDPFKRKVNTQTFNNYNKIIKHPMDFETLQKKLRTGSISSIKNFKTNLDLIWNNCILFNGEISELGQLALQTKKYIDDLWLRCKLPPHCIALENLIKLEKNLTKIEQSFTKLLNIQNKPDFKLPPKPRDQIIQKLPQQNQDSQPLTQNQLRSIAERLSKSDYSTYPEAWAILSKYITSDTKEIPISKLEEKEKIELRKIVIK